MKIYLVGGAVRDQLLGRKIHDRDYVVLNSNPKEMLKLGYKQVGKDFPVFLHPKTGEEYALARKELKVGKGYKGFEFQFDSSVTLKEDLMRRDFTINAMAQDQAGSIIDYFEGKKDLKKKILRHVSPHFTEDPLRVLRAFRFSANLGFEISNETQSLLKEIIQTEEFEHLSSDRVLLELRKVQNWEIFLSHLEQFEMIGRVFPDFQKIKNSPDTFLKVLSLCSGNEMRKKFNLKRQEIKLLEAITYLRKEKNLLGLLSNAFKLCRRSDEFLTQLYDLISFFELYNEREKFFLLWNRYKSLKFNSAMSPQDIEKSKLKLLKESI